MKFEIIFSFAFFISCSFAVSNSNGVITELWQDLVSTCRETLSDHICSEFRDQETRFSNVFQEFEKSYEIGPKGVFAVTSILNKLSKEMSSIDDTGLALDIMTHAFDFDKSASSVSDAMKREIQANSDADVKELDGKLYVSSDRAVVTKPFVKDRQVCNRQQFNELASAKRDGHRMIKEKFKMAVKFVSQKFQEKETTEVAPVKRDIRVTLAARLVASLLAMSIGVFLFIDYIPLAASPERTPLSLLCVASGGLCIGSACGLIALSLLSYHKKRQLQSEIETNNV